MPGRDTVRAMKKSVISTERAPGAIGPYSQAIRAGELLFCSGQIPLDATGALVGGDDVAAQTRQCMDNLAAVLEAGGASFASAVKCTIFLEDMGDFAAVNKVYASYFEGLEPPARACVAVRTLPKNVKVEIDAIAIAR